MVEIVSRGTEETMSEGGGRDGNVLYYGDNLDVLRRYIENESIDLVYLDPPFKRRSALATPHRNPKRCLSELSAQVATKVT